jgi:Ca-activated chloride channel homolog
MSFLWPGLLSAAILIPIAILAYLLLLRRKKRSVIRYSSLSLVRSAAPKSAWIKRHLPFALLMASLASLTTAMARPVTIARVPTDQRTIILAMDVSLSMCSTDIEPNRLIAAENAAITFVQNERPGTQFGLVAFAGFAEVVQTPTKDRVVLQQAIENLTTGRRTAVGSAILKSIDAIAEIDPQVPPSTNADDPESPPAPEPLPKGAYVPHIIVLLTDGATNSGPQPQEAAQQAIDRGIRVYTIGFGTARGSEIPLCGQGFIGREPNTGGGLRQGGGTGGNGGFLGGGRVRRGIDEAALQEVARITDAEYFPAASSEELLQAFQTLPTNLIIKTETTEVGAYFAIGGALLAMLAIAFALRWAPLP